MTEMYYIAYSKPLHKMLYICNLFSYYIQLSDLAGSLPQRGRPRVNRYLYAWEIIFLHTYLTITKKRN